MLAVHVKNEARTKVTFNYELVPCGEITEAAVTSIGWNKARIACGGDYKNFDSYNKVCAKDKKLGLQKISDCENLFSELNKQLAQIEQSMTVDKVMALINTERIDEYIITITIQVPVYLNHTGSYLI